MNDSASRRSSTSNPSPLGPVRPGLLLLIAAVLGLAFEILFFDRAPGISVFVWCVLGVAAVLGASSAEGTRPSWSALVLLPLILVLAWMTYRRLEPLTVFLDVVLVLTLFTMVIRFLRHDQLWNAGWLDLGLATVWGPLESLVRPWPVVGQVWESNVRESGRRKVAFSVLRGVILALPLLVVFGALLGTADLVFGDYLEAALRWLDLERLLEYAGRTTVVVVVSLFCLGAMIVALRSRAEERLIGQDRPLVAPFLGMTESVVVLIALNLLFAAFVAVQFTYLFGGEANINAAGYTYADYARRGFGELVAVAALSLGLVYAMAAVTRRDRPGQRRTFSWLGTLLVVLVGVILISAYQRLVLYENAYGFSRLRTYTHVALIWLGVTFAAFLVLLWMGRLRAFAPVMLGVAIGFTLTMNVLNVDAFIAEQNTRRWSASGEIDALYLLQLSDDAVPGLAALARAAPEAVREDLLPQLSCRLASLTRTAAAQAWPSRHASRDRARVELQGIADFLEPYRVVLEYHGESQPRWPLYQVRWEGGSEYCSMTWD